MATRLKTTKKLSTKELNKKLIGKDLHKVMMDWKNAINAYEKIKPIPAKLNTILEDHFSSVMGVIRQYMTNDESSTESSKAIGGQRKTLEREFFRSEVNHHLIKKHKGAFPSWKNFVREMDKHNLERSKLKLPPLDISSRSYDVFISEWKNGVFDFPQK